MVVVLTRDVFGGDELVVHGQFTTQRAIVQCGSGFVLLRPPEAAGLQEIVNGLVEAKGCVRAAREAMHPRIIGTP